MTATAILLIPGFFGYASFGPDNAPILEYFGGVRKALLSQPLLKDHFVAAHEPPPTGSLQSRVASLHDAMGKLLRGELLPHGRQPFKAERIHLVGHSTGGVDARLYANLAYPAGVDDAERKRALASLGNIVTLSAPLRGTPLATNIKGDNALLLEAVRVLTMAGVFTRGDLVRLGLALAKFSPGALLDHPLAIPKAFLSSLSPRHFVDALVPLLFPKDKSLHGRSAALLAEVAKLGETPVVNRQVATQVSAFFGSVEKHHELLGNLTVEWMAQHTQGLAPTDYGLNPGDRGKIFSYVSVAPPPATVPLLDLDAIKHLELIQAFIYATLYQATKEPPSLPSIVPAGPAIDTDASALVGAPSASDGVVSTRSQTLDGRATGIVLGDHLDVVGSYEGGSGANVMRSGAGFTGDRFDRLWHDIGRLLE